MFTKSQAVFFHCLSPVHMGSGTALGVIDNPIQRERHTEFPVFAGSGIKGALRHHLQAQSKDPNELNAIFGPPSERGSDTLHAGAISFTDAHLLLFPVRSTKRAYVYLTCPLALATTQRLLALSGHKLAWPISPIPPGTALTASGNGTLGLELFEYTAQPGAAPIAKDIAGFLPRGDEWKPFREKVANDLVIVPDGEFTYFVKNATLVEPHVAIDDDTGAADGGKLFYTENLPPESVLVGLLMASKTRTRKEKPLDLSADAVLKKVTEDWHQEGAALQIGGDATTGRGQVVVRYYSNGGAQ